MNKQYQKSMLRVSASVLIICLMAVVFFVNIAFVVGEMDGLLDFGSFIAAGQLANEGKNPYENNSPLIFSVAFHGIDHFGVAPNLNPPISVLIFQQIGNVPPLLSIKVWRVLTMLFYFLSIFLLIKRSPAKTNPNLFWKTIWALSLAGFWHTIQLGQIYTLLLLLVIGVVINIEKGKNILAGIILGILIAIKPNFIFWALALGITGYWSIFFSAGVIAVCISLIPVYFYGFKIYQEWLEATKLFTPDLLIFPGNNSLEGLTAHFNTAQTGVFLSIVLSIAGLIIIYKYKTSTVNLNALSIVISLLISPIAWTGYTILTTPIFFSSESWKLEHWLSGVIFAVPFFFILQLFEKSQFNFVFWGWFYGWGLLLLLFLSIKDIIISSKNRSVSQVS